jgi:hypothetical protein
LEWLAAEEVSAAGHRVVEVSKRQLIVEASAAIMEPPPQVGSAGGARAQARRTRSHPVSLAGQHPQIVVAECRIRRDSFVAGV